MFEMLEHGLAVEARKRAVCERKPVRGGGDVDSPLDEDIQIEQPRMDTGRTASYGEDRSGGGQESCKGAVCRVGAKVVALQQTRSDRQ